MTKLLDLTVDQLQRVISLKEQIEALEAELANFGGTNPVQPDLPKGRGVYKRSKAVRMAMATAQRMRWAKLKGGDEAITPKKKRKMSAAGRAKIAAAAKARWAKARSAGKKSL